MQFTDQLHHTIHLTEFPKRIVSVVPSQTELLWDLGLREEIVGITKFCIHPNELFIDKPKVGGTKTLDINKIRALKPDLIIANKEENNKEQIFELQKEFNVWISDINILQDAYSMILSIGELVNKKVEAFQLVKKINLSFSNLKKHNQTVLYLIWKNPYMASGKGTFIGDLLEVMGLNNILVSPTERYPQLSLEEIINLNAQCIFLSSEPFPFKSQHILELQKALPQAKILLVDGELFSWYGSRLLKSVDYFNALEIK